MPNQDPDEYFTEMFQQRDKLEHIGEIFTEARILGLILEGLSEEYEPIRFAAERVPEITLTEIKTTVRNMYANRVARGSGSTFLHGKGRESTMRMSLGFTGSLDYRNRLGYRKDQFFQILHEFGEGSLPSSGTERRSWCSLHNTDLHENTDCHAQHQQHGNVGGGGNTWGNNNRGNCN